MFRSRLQRAPDNRRASAARLEVLSSQELMRVAGSLARARRRSYAALRSSSPPKSSPHDAAGDRPARHDATWQSVTLLLGSGTRQVRAPGRQTVSLHSQRLDVHAPRGRLHSSDETRPPPVGWQASCSRPVQRLWWPVTGLPAGWLRDRGRRRDRPRCCGGPRLNGSTGSTTAASSARSDTSRQPSTNDTSNRILSHRFRSPDSTNRASCKPGAPQNFHKGG